MNRMTLAKLLCVAPLIVATAHAQTPTVSPDAYFTADNGVAPNHQFSIAERGGSESKTQRRIYLITEPAHHKIEPLEEINRLGDFTDSAALVQWSPDSRHFAVEYYIPRFHTVLFLYRVVNGHPRRVALPNLVSAAKVGGVMPGFDGGANSPWNGISLKWLSANRFHLVEYCFVGRTTSAVAPLGKYYFTTFDDSHGVVFSAEAVCELTAGGKWRVVSVKPGVQSEYYGPG